MNTFDTHAASADIGTVVGTGLALGVGLAMLIMRSPIRTMP